MRILYVHPKAWTGEYPILRKLRELGHEVCVLEEQRGLPAGARWYSDHFLQPGDGIPTFWYDPRRGIEKLLTLPIDRLLKPAFNGRNLGHRMRIIRCALRRFRPDVVICSDGFSYAIPAGLLNALGLFKPKLIASYIGGDVLEIPRAGQRSRWSGLGGWLLRRSFHNVDVLRPVSPLIANELKLHGAPPARITVIPSHLGTDAETLTDVWNRRAEISTALRARYGMSERTPLVITLCNNQEAKGVHLLAAAWPQICREVPGASWLIGGPPHAWLDEAVWPVLRRAGLVGSVRATGPLTGVAVFEHLAAADININATLSDGLNMVAVEAAAVGTPTITSDAAGVADWVQRYEAGAVVPVGDVDALASSVIDALRRPNLRLTWSGASRRMAADFALDRVAHQLLTLFEQ